MGTQLPPPKKKERTTAPTFRPMSIVGKTDGLIKMPLGMEVSLGPGHTVLDVVPGWLDHDAT